jgi:uncharacterized protein DUF2490
VNLYASKKNDFQIWNYDSIFDSLSKRVDLYAEIAFRFKNNATTFFYNHEHIEFPISVTSYMTIGPSYRQVWVLDSGDFWTTRYEPNLNIAFFKWYRNFLFRDRSRVTYRIYGTDTPNVWQYRNKFSIYRPWKKIQAFIDDEIFIEERQRGIYQNRATIGIDFKLIEKVIGEIGYRLQTIRQNNVWHNNSILLLDLRVTF